MTHSTFPGTHELLVTSTINTVWAKGTFIKYVYKNANVRTLVLSISGLIGKKFSTRYYVRLAFFGVDCSISRGMFVCRPCLPAWTLWRRVCKFAVRCRRWCDLRAAYIGASVSAKVLPEAIFPVRRYSIYTRAPWRKVVDDGGKSLAHCASQ